VEGLAVWQETFTRVYRRDRCLVLFPGAAGKEMYNTVAMIVPFLTSCCFFGRSYLLRPANHPGLRLDEHYHRFGANPVICHGIGRYGTSDSIT